MMLEYIEFYKIPILSGTAAGILLSFLGIFVVLRKTSLFGVTMSQAAGAAVIISFMLGIHGEIFIIAATSLMMLPFFIMTGRKSKFSGAILTGGFVFFTSAGHLITVFGGNVSNHITRAFFGDILTVTQEEWDHLTLPVFMMFPVFIYFLPYFKIVVFDRDHAAIRGLNIRFLEAAYFLMLVFILSISIRLFGSLFSIAQLILPALAVLHLSRSVNFALLYAMLFSITGTLTGFIVSFYPFQAGNETLNLPTTSSIIMVLSFGTVLLFGTNRLKYYLIKITGNIFFRYGSHKNSSEK